MYQQVAQEAAAPAKETAGAAPGDARGAMLSAIKNGQFKLRKTPAQAKGVSREVLQFLPS